MQHTLTLTAHRNSKSDTSEETIVVANFRLAHSDAALSPTRERKKRRAVRPSRRRSAAKGAETSRGLGRCAHLHTPSAMRDATIEQQAPNSAGPSPTPSCVGGPLSRRGRLYISIIYIYKRSTSLLGRRARRRTSSRQQAGQERRTERQGDRDPRQGRRRGRARGCPHQVLAHTCNQIRS